MDRSWENQALNDDDTTNHWLVRRPVHAQFVRMIGNWNACNYSIPDRFRIRNSGRVPIDVQQY